MIKPEILAPAGSPQALIAAVRSGADAVYLGIKGLNARRSAENFDDDQLKEAVACRAYSQKCTRDAAPRFNPDVSSDRRRSQKT